MQGIVAFGTELGNKYLYSQTKKCVVLNHPIINKIINSGDEEKIINELLNEKSITIDNCEFDKNEISHYCKKYLFFKKNGFFEEVDTEKIISGNINRASVEEQLNKIDNVVFEITENCNLRCEYCIYGEHYSTHEDREYSDMDIHKSKAILDYLVSRWMSDSSNLRKKIVIGFYGGEALLRMDTIKEIVEYVKDISVKTGLNFKFNMTTNGVLIDKHIDYLVKNNFSVLVSLDGDKDSNSYRILKNGESSFDMIYRNIKSIREKYNDFFVKNINFNAVLHNRNDEKNVKEFFKKEFDKNALCSLLKPHVDNSDIDLNYKPKSDILSINNDNDKNIFFASGSSLNFYLFIHHLLNNVYLDYRNIEDANVNEKIYYPTGACFPFNKKIFLTAQGNILACERINFKFVLGKVVDNEININSQYISDMYNDYFNRIRQTCANCHRFLYCSSCLFSEIIDDKDNLKCGNFLDYEGFGNFISYYWTFFEKYPNIYNELLENIKYE